MWGKHHAAKGISDDIFFSAFAATSGAIAQEIGFPDVSTIPFDPGLNGADCAAAEPGRSTAISEHEGFSAHPFNLCWEGQRIAVLIFWSQTNAEGTMLSVNLSGADGSPLPLSGGGYDPATEANVYELHLELNGTPVVCPIRKPSGGIAPENVSICS